MLEIAAICLVITALLAYLNHRFVGIPTTIGVMASALIFSLALIGLDAVGIAQDLREYEESFLRSIDFSDVMMQGMLSLLLFAAALHVDLDELKAHRLPMAALAVLGTLASTLVVAFGIWVVLPVAALQGVMKLPPGSWKVLTWGGLRGGISVALALSLPIGPERNTVVALTYGIVVFSILAQGLSIGHLSRQTARSADRQARSRADRVDEP